MSARPCRQRQRRSHNRDDGPEAKTTERPDPDRRRRGKRPSSRRPWSPHSGSGHAGSQQDQLGLAYAGDIEQVFDRLERSMFLAKRDDPLGKNRADTVELGEPGCCRPIEIDATVIEIPRLAVGGDDDLLSVSQWSGEIEGTDISLIACATGRFNCVGNPGRDRERDQPRISDRPRHVDDHGLLDGLYDRRRLRERRFRTATEVDPASDRNNNGADRCNQRQS